MRFLSVRPDFCRRLPSDSTSRWTPLPLAICFPSLGRIGDFHPLEHAHAGRTTKSSPHIKACAKSFLFMRCPIKSGMMYSRLNDCHVIPGLTGDLISPAINYHSRKHTILYINYLKSMPYKFGRFFWLINDKKNCSF